MNDVWSDYDGAVAKCESVEDWILANDATGALDGDPVQILLARCGPSSEVPTRGPACDEIIALYPDFLYTEPYAERLAAGPPEQMSEPVEITMSGVLEGDYLTVSGTANLPDESGVKISVADGEGFEEALTAAVRGGVFEVSFWLLDYAGAGQFDVVANYIEVEKRLTVTR